MPVVKLNRKVTPLRLSELDLLSKIRCSLHQRLRKQIDQLSAGFFDEADDFLFARGSVNQLAGDGDCLKSMRELRTRQGLFEEALLAGISQRYQGPADSENAMMNAYSIHRSGNADEVYEKVEVDLALQAMRRKAAKIYAPLAKQITDLNESIRLRTGQAAVVNDSLVEATIGTLAEAQYVFSLSLEIRLIFIKLFEKHFLLQIDKILLDTISILKNSSDKAFVEKLYTSASALSFQSPSLAAEIPSSLDAKIASVQPADRRAEIVGAEVNSLIDETLKNEELPEFTRRMIMDHWRDVMILVGVNRGIGSAEWSKASQTLLLLSQTLSGTGKVTELKIESLQNQLRQGFNLVRVSNEYRKQFLAELDDCISLQNESINAIDSVFPCKAENTQIGVILESTVSPAGEELLNKDDLNEIVAFLESEGGGLNNTVIERRLTEFMPAIEAMAEGSAIECLVKGAYVFCQVSRNASNKDLFDISSADARVLLTRSKLGFAISLQSKELRFPACFEDESGTSSSS